MQDYHLKLKEISLKEAVELMKKNQVFYNYKIGEALFKLDNESLASSISGDAKYFTPNSWLEMDEQKVLTNEDFNKLNIINKIIWQATDRLIMLDGHSDLTLHLEGSYHDIRDMIGDEYNK